MRSLIIKNSLLVSITWVVLLSGCSTSLQSILYDDKFTQEYKSYRENAKSGNEDFKRGEYDSAVKTLTAAIKANHFDVNSYYYRGVAYFRTGEDKKALKDLSRVLIMDPNVVSAYVYRGLIFEKREDYPNAMADYTTALSLAPDDVHVLNNLAWLHATAKDENFRNKDQALKFAKRAADLTHDNNAQVLDTLARAYHVSGKAVEALEAQKKAIELEPENEKFLRHLSEYEGSVLNGEQTVR